MRLTNKGKGRRSFDRIDWTIKFLTKTTCMLTLKRIYKEALKIVAKGTKNVSHFEWTKIVILTMLFRRIVCRRSRQRSRGCSGRRDDGTRSRNDLSSAGSTATREAGRAGNCWELPARSRSILLRSISGDSSWSSCCTESGCPPSWFACKSVQGSHCWQCRRGWPPAVSSGRCRASSRRRGHEKAGFRRGRSFCFRSTQGRAPAKRRWQWKVSWWRWETCLGIGAASLPPRSSTARKCSGSPSSA